MPVAAKLHACGDSWLRCSARSTRCLWRRQSARREAHFGAIAFLQVNHALRHLQQRGGVGGGEALAFANPAAAGTHARTTMRWVGSAITAIA